MAGFEHKPVISGRHSSGHPFLEVRMEDLVRHVGEVRLLRSDFTGYCNGLIDGHVHWMRPIPQGIEHENVQVIEKRKTRIGYFAHVRQVGKASNPEPEHIQRSMDSWNGGNANASIDIFPGCDLKWPPDFMHFKTRNARITPVTENVGEHGAQHVR